MPLPGEQPHAGGVAPLHPSETVVLDLVQPFAAGRQLIGFGWEARRDESGREGTLQHSKPNTVG